MPATHLIPLDYEGRTITYRDDGWFNATEAATHYGKEPVAWLRQSDTAEYIAALCKHQGNSGFLTEFNEIKELDATSPKARRQLLDLAKRSGMVSTKAGAPENGGGTWLHPKLGVPFARWLDVNFAVWCDIQIDSLIRNKQDWREHRHAATAGAKLLALTLKTAREAQGKATQDYHYSNEHLMLNKLITGERKACDRDSVDQVTLDAIVQMQIRDSMLILKDLPYKDRQDDLQRAVLALSTYPRLPAASMIPSTKAKALKGRGAANDPKLDA